MSYVVISAVLAPAQGHFMNHDNITDITTYLRAQANELGSRILESYPPLQSTTDEIPDDLSKLLRTALPAQAIAIGGLAKHLRSARAARIVAECGVGKTHIALALGLAACQNGHRVRFTTAAALVSELIEARDEKHLLRFQKQLAAYELLIVDELGFVPLSKTGAELLFELISQRYERASVLVTSNLPFDEWTQIFGSERLTGALLDRLTHHVHILEMNGDSYRLKQSRRKRNPPSDR